VDLAIRFDATIQRLYDDGFRVFIELGAAAT
jgi:acyl transferase domain-containing protein